MTAPPYCSGRRRLAGTFQATTGNLCVVGSGVPVQHCRNAVDLVGRSVALLGALLVALVMSWVVGE